jgi:hypothetical protein
LGLDDINAVFTTEVALLLKIIASGFFFSKME